MSKVKKVLKIADSGLYNVFANSLVAILGGKKTTDIFSACMFKDVDLQVDIHTDQLAALIHMACQESLKMSPSHIRALAVHLGAMADHRGVRFDDKSNFEIKFEKRDKLID